MTPLSVQKGFKPDDRVALFVMSMAMAANDIENSIHQAVYANPDGASEEDRQLGRFSQKVRLTNGFLFEGIDALKAWRQHEPDVAKLLRGLPPDGAKALSTVCGLEQRIGPKALSTVRQGTFHYPHPDPGKSPDSTVGLAAVVAEADNVEVSIHVGGQHTFPFADQIAAGLALSAHDDEGKAQEKIRDGAVAFVHLARFVFMAFCKQRGIRITDAGHDD